MKFNKQFAIFIGTITIITQQFCLIDATCMKLVTAPESSTAPVTATVPVTKSTPGVTFANNEVITNGRDVIVTTMEATTTIPTTTTTIPAPTTTTPATTTTVITTTIMLTTTVLPELLISTQIKNSSIFLQFDSIFSNLDVLNIDLRGVRAYISSGLDLNVRNAEGQTALILCIYRKNLKTFL